MLPEDLHMHHGMQTRESFCLKLFLPVTHMLQSDPKEQLLHSRELLPHQDIIQHIPQQKIMF